METSAFGALASDTSPGEQDLVLILPPTSTFASDEEAGDSNVSLAGNIDLPKKDAWTIELHQKYDHDWLVPFPSI